MNKKNNNILGITLIALVITIIILLILAGVSVTILYGENGIINTANDAKQQTEKAQIIEMIRLKILAEKSKNNGKISEEKLNEILKEFRRSYSRKWRESIKT